MNIYTRKIRWKLILFFIAAIIGISSLWYTNALVKKLAVEEHKKVELWAKATSLIVNTELSSESLEFMASVIQNNETVPVILIDKDTNIIQKRNLDSLKSTNPEYLRQVLKEMMSQNPPIEIPIFDNNKQYLYYSRSIILTKLLYYPLIQFGVILLFIAIAYMAFSSSRKAEQNQVWVGLSKETAHQLGTPISSLMAWLEILKLRNTDKGFISELEKDVLRLNKITERFSKIGSKPVLKPENLINSINNTISYLKTRSSKKVVFNLVSEEDQLIVPLNTSLFEWVIENLCKNSMDAIEGEGRIHITVSDNLHFVFIDIADSGKGIPKSKHKTVFKPGFTTKERGWGLGLSLTKRIVEEYHNGKIFVSSSEVGKGTTIRIILKK
jgi:signal transduction histidine kinase